MFPYTYNEVTKWSSLAQMRGNQYVLSTLVNAPKASFITKVDLIKGVKVVGHMVTAGGVVLDGVGLFNYYKNPDASHVATPEEAGVNTGVTVISYWIPMAGVTMVLWKDFILEDGKDMPEIRSH